MLKATLYSNDKGWSDVRHIDDVSELRRHDQNLIWAVEDVRELSEEDVACIQEEFELSPSAVEAAVSARSRPKIEPLGKELFAVIYQLDEIDEQLEAIQIAAFVGNDFVLVLHAGATRTLTDVQERFRQTDVIKGPQDLLYFLFDALVTEYQETADRIEDEVEYMEEIVLAAPVAPVQRNLYSLKQQVARVRRYALPWGRLMEEAIDADRAYWNVEVRLERLQYLRDRLLRINDQVRNIDELTQALIDFTRAEQGERLNENQRRLSAWAAIFAVATVIAGIYGMNFRLVPEDQTLLGFWFAMALIVLSSGSMYFYFKRKGWL